MFDRMLFNQARHRWNVTLLIWVAIAALVTLYVYSRNSARFNNRSMQLIMKQMGYHLLILPRDTEPAAVYLCGEGQVRFPDVTTEELARHMEISSRYYTSVLQHRVEVDGGAVILTGARPVHRPDETAEKAHLFEAIPAGTARLGSRAASLLGVAPDDTIDLMGRTFRVGQVLPEYGYMDDYRVFVPLSEAQQALDAPGQINVIWSFLCMHGKTLPEVIANQKKSMAGLFPDLVAITRMNLARARDVARRSTSGYLGHFVALVGAITVVVVAVTGLQEVNERKGELGIMLAMGTGYTYIVSLYLAKMLIVALTAATGGFVVGSLLSRRLLADLLVVNTRPMGVLWEQLPGVLVLTCLVVAVAEVLPMARLLTLDPNVILTEE